MCVYLSKPLYLKLRGIVHEQRVDVLARRGEGATDDVP